MTATVNHPDPRSATLPPPTLPSTAPSAGPAIAGSTMADSTTLGRWLSRLDEVFVAVLAVVAVEPFRRLFVSSRVVVLAVGVVVVALLIALATRRLRLAFAVVMGLLGAAVYVVAVVYRVGIDDGRTLAGVWDGISGSWANLLTATVPAGTSPELASVPVLLAWLAAQFGVMLSVRTRSASLPVVPAIVAFAGSLLFTGEQGLASPLVVGALIVLALAVVLLRANLFAVSGSSAGTSADGYGMDVSRRSLPIGQMRVGGLVVAVVAVAAVVAAPLIPITSTDARIDLHDRYDPPLDVSDALSPLSTLRSGLNDTSREPLFTVRFSGVANGTTIDRIRAVVLDTYDGTVWGTDATFARAGSEIPLGEAVTAPTLSIGQHIVLGTYASSFLPALDRPSTVAGNGLGFDRVSGMLIGGEGSRAGYTYDLTSAVPVITEAAAHQARPGIDPAVARLSLGPPGGWSPAIERFAATIPTTSDPYDMLIGIRDELRSPAFGYSTKGRPGHSLGVIGDFLTAPAGGAGVATARVGYAEQFAAAFAILARVQGLPSRVVVGYRVDPVAATAGTDIEVLAQDVHAWAEVNLNGVGWVAFDPTNPTDREPVEPPAAPETTIAPVETVAPSTVPPTSAPQTKEPDRPTTETGGDGDGFPWVVVVVPLVLLAGPVMIVLAKALLRRRRRGHGDPSHRVVGAWREAGDRLSERGQHIPRGATVNEVAATAAPAVAPALQQLAPIVDRALFAVAAPDDELVAAAWAAEATVARAANDGAGLGRRARATVDPRPLVTAIRRSRR